MRCQGQKRRAPDLVFLCHGVDFTGLVHIPYFVRSFAAQPCSSQWCVRPIMPLILLDFFGWQWTNTHIISRYTVGEFNQEIWALPRLGFQFFLPFGKDKINELIEEAILEADIMTVKVISLGGLVKLWSEWGLEWRCNMLNEFCFSTALHATWSSEDRVKLWSMDLLALLQRK